MWNGASIAAQAGNAAWNIVFQQDELLIRRLQRQINVQFKTLEDCDTLIDTLRDVRLVGDKAVHIYEHATIRPKKYLIDDLYPLSLYVLGTQIAQHKRMFWHLQQYGQNLFDFTGLMRYAQNGQTYTIAPPIVEVYTEPTSGEAVAVIIDGLHRIYAARQLGFDELWVITVSGLPKLLPPIALPVDWNDVKLSDVVPGSHSKRRYRFERAIDYPDMSAVTDVPITPENYQYFLYRDLSILGSSGIRS